MLQPNGKAFMESLQREGVMELSPIKDDRLTAVDARFGMAVWQQQRQITQEALQILSEYVPQKGGVMTLFSGRKTMDSRTYDDLVKHIDRYFRCAWSIVSSKRKIEDAKAEITKQRVLLQALEVWTPLDLPTSYTGTAYTSVFIGTFPTAMTRETLLNGIAERCPGVEAMDAEIIHTAKEQTAVLVVCHRAVKEPVYAAIRGMGFTAPPQSFEYPPAVQSEQWQRRIAALETVIHTETTTIVSSADQRSDIEFLWDYYTVKCDEYAAQERVCLTDTTLLMRGYVPVNRIETIERLADGCGAAISVYDPEEGDDVPVVLHNNAFASPVESITEMYALPGKHDIDPSGIMAFFYYLLFGMMLSDAGYGVIMTVGSWWILKKTAVEGAMRKMLRMFFCCGISTVFWGTLFGSWFGDIIPIIYTHFLNKPAPSIALWFEPIQDPITLLLFSFMIGIAHLFLGLITAGRLRWKSGQKGDAVWDTVPVILLVLGAAPLAAGVMITVPAWITNISAYVAVVGAVLVVLTASRHSRNFLARLGGGLYGLYNVASGYLSDILSYSRLLALGLATGSIASVINMMGVMPKSLALKSVLLPIVFVLGHALNMAINVLGAYVHTNRLQFVELFSKFYEGGGRAFAPLQTHTKYFKFKGDLR